MNRISNKDDDALYSHRKTGILLVALFVVAGCDSGVRRVGGEPGDKAATVEPDLARGADVNEKMKAG